MDYLIPPDRLDKPDFTVRSYEPGDGKLLAQAARESHAHVHPFLAWAKPDYSDEEGERYSRTSRAHYLLADGFSLGIFSPDGRRQLGGTGFHLREGGLSSGNAEIGMWIHADEAGKGLGTRVLTALLYWGFDAWPWVRTVWRCDTRNIGSARVAEKAGMQQEAMFRSDFPIEDGKRRDTFLFAALKDEWLSQHPR